MDSTQSRKVNIMNTLITWNQLREMEEASQNRFNRFLGGFPSRIGSGETHSLTVADWSPEVDISEDDRGYLLKADLPEMKKDGVRVTVEDGILSVSGERKTQKEAQKEEAKSFPLKMPRSCWSGQYRTWDDSLDLSANAIRS